MVQVLAKKWRRSPVRQFYCAFCRSPREIFNKKHVTVSNVLASAVSSFIFMMLIWHGWNGRVLVFFVFALAISEFFIQIRWRLSVPCPQCGFDPVIYKQSHKQAAEQVRQHLEKRSRDPLAFLSAQARLNLPARKGASERRINSSRLDRTI